MAEPIIILDHLASVQGRKDEVPNQELAQRIVNSDASIVEKAIEDLIGLLSHKDKEIQNDVIKVLYEVGALNPQAIADYLDNFVGLLDHKNNRLQWGAMTAISSMTAIKASDIYNHLPQIISAADRGSVITRDHAMNILVRLASIPQYANDAVPLILEQLYKSPGNQLSMYAERVQPAITDNYKNDFIKILESRINDLTKESKQKRIEKMIRTVKKSIA